jgi:hypothetical protein
VLMKWLGPGSRVQVYAQGPRSGPFRKLHTRIVPFRAGSTYLKVGWVTPGLLAMD